MSDLERLLSNTAPFGNGCMVWLGKVNKSGYGSCGAFRVSVNGKKVQLAHRVSYFFATGNLSNDKVIDHKYFNRACINPDHLREVTGVENGQCKSPVPHSEMVRMIAAQIPGWPGERDDYRKLTLREQIDLRDRYWSRVKNGETVKQIAEAFGIKARSVKTRVDAMGKE